MPNSIQKPPSPFAILATAVAALALTFGLFRAVAHHHKGKYHVAYAQRPGDLLTHTEPTPDAHHALVRLERALWEDYSAIS